MPDPAEIPWFIPSTTVRLPDGSTLVKPGKAIQRAKAERVAAIFGIDVRVLSRLADCGLIRRATLTPRVVFYYPGEIEELIKKTEEDPGFWNDVRLKAYLTGDGIRASKPRSG